MVVDQAVLTSIGVDEEGRRVVLGVSVESSEAAVHWRTFLTSPVRRGLRGVQLIVT